MQAPKSNPKTLKVKALRPFFSDGEVIDVDDEIEVSWNIAQMLIHTGKAEVSDGKSKSSAKKAD